MAILSYVSYTWLVYCRWGRSENTRALHYSYLPLGLFLFFFLMMRYYSILHTTYEIPGFFSAELVVYDEIREGDFFWGGIWELWWNQSQCDCARMQNPFDTHAGLAVTLSPASLTFWSILLPSKESRCVVTMRNARNNKHTFDRRATLSPCNRILVSRATHSPRTPSYCLP